MSRSPTKVSFTVQGVEIPVPAVVRGDQAGSQTFSSSSTTSRSGTVEVDSLASTTPSQKKIIDLISVPTQKIAAKSPPGLPIRPLDVSMYKNEDLQSILGIKNAKISMLLTAFETQRHVTKETKSAITDLAALNTRAIQLHRYPDGGSADKGPHRGAAKNKKRPAKPHPVMPPSFKPIKMAIPNAREPKPSSYATLAKNACKRDMWAKVMPERLRKNPEGLILTKTGEAFYADMLRKLKANPSLSDFDKHVKKIRRT